MVVVTSFFHGVTCLEGGIHPVTRAATPRPSASVTAARRLLPCERRRRGMVLRTLSARSSPPECCRSILGGTATRSCEILGGITPWTSRRASFRNPSRSPTEGKAPVRSRAILLRSARQLANQVPGGRNSRPTARSFTRGRSGRDGRFYPMMGRSLRRHGGGKAVGEASEVLIKWRSRCHERGQE
jgi:hypothetical protein